MAHRNKYSILDLVFNTCASFSYFNCILPPFLNFMSPVKGSASKFDLLLGLRCSLVSECSPGIGNAWFQPSASPDPQTDKCPPKQQISTVISLSYMVIWKQPSAAPCSISLCSAWGRCLLSSILCGCCHHHPQIEISLPSGLGRALFCALLSSFTEGRHLGITAGL